MTIYYLLIENVNLEEVRKGEKDEKEKKIIVQKLYKLLKVLQVQLNIIYKQTELCLHLHLQF